MNYDNLQKYIYLIFILIFSGTFCFSENVYTVSEELLHNSWAKVYGGAGTDYISSIHPTTDNGFIVSGYTNSFGAGNNDIWVLKLDSGGAIQWQKTYGAGGDEEAKFVIQTSDGKYIIAGSTTSYGTGGKDLLIIKLNETGAIETQTIYGDGASGIDIANDIKETADGGYIVAGQTNSYGTGNYDYWVLKLNSGLGIEWQKTYGGSGSDIAYSIQQTSDKGYIIAGITYSFGAGSSDIWALKTDGTGSIQWQKVIGGSSGDSANCIRQTTDSGYIIAGATNSFGAGGTDAWVIKLKNNGNVDWQKAYGGAGGDSANYIDLTADGGYILGASTYSFGNGNNEAWVLKLNAEGEIQWQKTYGGTLSDNLYQIKPTNDNDYIIAANTASFSAGSYDFWIIKIYSDGSVNDCNIINNTSATVTITNPKIDNTTISANNSSGLSGAANLTANDTGVSPYNVCATGWAKIYGGPGYEENSRIKQTSDRGFIISSHTNSFGAGLADIWLLKLDSAGEIMWQKTFGGTSRDYSYDVFQTADEGYIIAGHGEIGGIADIGVLKLDSLGNLQWERVFRPTLTHYESFSQRIMQVLGSGYIIAGLMNYSQGSIHDLLILKLDLNGNIQWAKLYGGSGDEIDPRILQTSSDGGYILAGQTSSFGAGGWDCWVIKLNSNGDIQWQRTFGTPQAEYCNDVVETTDGNYIITGESVAIGTNIFLLKINASGYIVWEKGYTNPSLISTYANAITQTADGGYIVAGRANTSGVPTLIGGLILKLDSSGNLQWQKLAKGLCFSSSPYNYFESVQQTFDYGYIASQMCDGSDEDPSTPSIRVVKLLPDGSINSNCNIMENVSFSETTIDFSIFNTIITPVNLTIDTYTPTPTITNTNVVPINECPSYSPGSISGTLRVSKSGNNPMLTWSAPPSSCIVNSYGIYRGNLPIASSYNHDSISCNITSLSYIDTAATGNHYYLVVPNNTEFEGSYGYDYPGYNERPSGINACKPKNTIPCN